MKIFLCYGYDPNTGAVYLERALANEHEVFYVGPPSDTRKGYSSNQDLSKHSELGLPRPDLVLFVEPGGKFFPRGLEKLECPTAVYLIDVHQNLPYRLAHAPFFDYVFVAQKDYIDSFRRAGFDQVFWLPLACDPEIHSMPPAPRRWDIGFVGNTRYGDRARRLALLAQQFSVSDYRRAYSKEEFPAIYAQSKLVFNNSIGGDLNMRVFEALASGSMLITDRIGNGQDELFQEGVDLVTYSDDRQLIEKVDYYLAHDLEREEIARNGQALVQSKHTYAQRCQSIMDTIYQGTGPNLAAPVRRVDESKRHLFYANIYSRLSLVDEVLDEFRSAWQTRRGYLAILGLAVLTFARSVRRGLL